MVGRLTADTFFQRVGQFMKDNLMIVGISGAILVILVIGLISICCYKCRKGKGLRGGKVKYSREKMMVSEGGEANSQSNQNSFGT